MVIDFIDSAVDKSKFVLPVFSKAGTGAVHALYIHIPFCFHKCHYCDFYSIVDNRDRQESFTKSLIAELRLACKQFEMKPKTIFAGGGTPTLLHSALWQKLLRAMEELGLLDAVQEFTVEANPETVNPELMQVLAAGGVNRVSIGAQSFDTELLKTLERWHDPKSVPRVVEIARQSGIDNINLDLIFAIPGQSDEQLENDLNSLLQLHPNHLSCYSLIFEPGTPLTKKKQLGRIKQVDEEKEARMYQRVIDRLEEAGFEHYEVSNWAQKGKRCKHNMVYWRSENYLGVGPSASSHIAGRRWRNKPHLGSYLVNSPHPEMMDYEMLDDDARTGEKLMLALRLREGIDIRELDCLLDGDQRRRQQLFEFERQNLLQRADGRLFVTQRGLMVVDGIAAELL